MYRQQQQSSGDDGRNPRNHQEPEKCHGASFLSDETRVRPDGTRVREIKVTLTRSNLNQGSATNQKVRDIIAIFKEPNDVAGHILARILGGSGSDAANIIAMDRALNNGEYKMFEREIYNEIKEHGEARITFTIEYRPGDERPIRIIFHVDIYENGKFIKILRGNFELIVDCYNPREGCLDR